MSTSSTESPDPAVELVSTDIVERIRKLKAEDGTVVLSYDRK